VIDLEFKPLPADPRDSGLDRDPNLAVQKNTIGAMTLHIPGVSLRAKVYRELHDQIGAMAQRRDVEKLCGIEHVEDVQYWQVPHAGRASLRKAITALEKQFRRPVVIVNGWQHVGSCP
jgi:hypothetical protein